MNLPRALQGRVYAMARPARPRGETEAVARAAVRIGSETGITAAEPLAREIARRVVAEMLADLDRHAFEAALAGLEKHDCPITQLATCPVIDTASAFVERRVNRLRARGGRDLSDFEQKAERRQVAEELQATLTRRYRRCL